MYEQISIFDVVADDKFNKIMLKLKKYGIDEYYNENFRDRGCLIKEIFESLTKLDKYNEYLMILYEELKAFIPVIKKEDDDFKTIGMYLEDNSIRICEARCWYSIGCLEMLNKDFWRKDDE